MYVGLRVCVKVISIFIFPLWRCCCTKDTKEVGQTKSRKKNSCHTAKEYAAIATVVSRSTVIIHYELLDVTQLVVQFLMPSLLLCVFVVLGDTRESKICHPHRQLEGLPAAIQCNACVSSYVIPVQVTIYTHPLTVIIIHTPLTLPNSNHHTYTINASLQ